MVSRNPAWPRNGVSATGWSRNQGAKGKALRGSTAAQTHRTPVEQSRIRPIEDQRIGVARDFREIALLVHERRAMRLRVAERRRGFDRQPREGGKSELLAARHASVRDGKIGDIGPGFCVELLMREIDRLLDAMIINQPEAALPAVGSDFVVIH